MLLEAKVSRGNAASGQFYDAGDLLYQVRKRAVLRKGSLFGRFESHHVHTLTGDRCVRCSLLSGIQCRCWVPYLLRGFVSEHRCAAYKNGVQYRNEVVRACKPVRPPGKGCCHAYEGCGR